MAAVSTANTTSSTTQKYVVFSFNYIDNPEFQEIMKKVLAGELDPRNVDWDVYLAGKRTSTTLATTISSGYNERESVNVGLIIPLIIVSFVLLMLLICVIWHSIGSRCTDANISKKHSISSLFRTMNTDIRSSTRSELLSESSNSFSGAGGKVSIPPVVTKVKLGSIRESPEDRWKESRIYPTDTSKCNTDSTVSHNVLKDFPYILSDIGSYPIPVHPGFPPEMAQSHPDLMYARMSPYQLTWVTPIQSSGVSLSDPVLSSKTVADCEKICKDFDSMLARPPGSDSKDISSSSTKSPYHPNFNTPTNSENENIAPNVFVNPSNSVSSSNTSPPVSNATGSGNVIYHPRFVKQVPAVLLQHHRQSLPSYNDSTPAGINSSRSSAFDATCVSAPLSCPSSVGTWHYNDVYNQPNQGIPQPVKKLLTQALLNSANRPTNAQILDPNAFLSANLQNVAVVGGQPVNLSMYPNVGSSNNSFTRLQAASAASTAVSGNGGSQSPSQESGGMPLSGNTSLCGHIDSCETSDNYSSMVTGAVSEQASGYAAGPSHSTSIEKNNSTSANNTRHLSFDSSTTTPGNSTGSIQGISAIQNATLNSEVSFGPQIFHQALSVDGTNASVTLSFASTAKSAPAALEYNRLGIGLLNEKKPPTGKSSRNSAGSNPPYSSGSSTPTPGSFFGRPLSSASNPLTSTKNSWRSNTFTSYGTTTDGGTTSGTFDWDSYPYIKNENSGSSATPVPSQTDVQGISSLPTQLITDPDCHESCVTARSNNPSSVASSQRRKSNQPLLADTQYWV